VKENHKNFSRKQGNFKTHRIKLRWENRVASNESTICPILYYGISNASWLFGQEKIGRRRK